MTTLGDSCFYTCYSSLRRRQAQEYEPHMVSGDPPLWNKPSVDSPTQRRFKCEAISLSNAPLDLRQHNPPRLNRRAIRIERRQPGGYQIDVYKIRTVSFLQ